MRLNGKEVRRVILGPDLNSLRLGLAIDPCSRYSLGALLVRPCLALSSNRNRKINSSAV